MTDPTPNVPDPASLAVLAVGHCGPDAWMLRAAVDRAIEGPVTFEAIGEEAALRARLGRDDTPTLLLVNRRLDGWFDAEDGITLLRSVLSSGRASVATVLVSDLADAQATAEAAGARPGFGKRALHAPATAEALRAAAAIARG